MALNLPYAVKMINPIALEYYYSNNGTPYTDETAAKAAVPLEIRYRGLTVNIAGEEWWWKAGTADINLVQKTNVSTDAHYIHSQGFASQTWTITHNLGKRPAIHFEDMSGNVMYPQVQHNSDNEAVATFGNATYSGTAYCN